MSDSNKPNKPQIEYRVELEKRIQINKSFSERRNQAVAMRILSYGLFGQKRYQNLYLSCSLNCFHLALKIANQIHQRVAGLAMIIKFETVQVLEYFSEPFQGQYFEEKKYSKIVIKLTRNPTEEDKKEPGYNKGLTADEVEEPLTEVLKRKKGGRDSKPTQKPRDRDRFQDRQRERERQRQRDSYGPRKAYRKDNDYPKRDQRGDRGEKKRRYREASNERVDEREYHRGEKKIRGGQRNQNNTSRRDYDDRRDDRRDNRKGNDDRGNRRPRRNRYDDQDD